MFNIQTTDANILETKSLGYIFFFEQDKVVLNKEILELIPFAQEITKQREFKGSNGQILDLTAQYQGQAITCLLVGIGTHKNDILSLEHYRRAIAKCVRVIEKFKLTTISIELPYAKIFNISTQRLAYETTVVLLKSGYHFDEFITEKSARVSINSEIYLCSNNIENNKEINDGINLGNVVGKAINDARTWCDTPPSRLTPAILAHKAKEIADKNNLKITIFNQSDITKMGMGGLEGVAQGSQHECKFVILEYNCNRPNAQTIGLVGKGITFDSGGLSIKPANSMETMKDDMAGAAIVISTMQVIANTRPGVNVIAFAPIAENMPSGTAIKPGDVLRFYNGKTAEVKNTDAEGRLILADALSYAVKNYNLNAIIDIATLTGACKYAVGPGYAALLSQHDDLAAKIQAAAKISGDKVWPLPMDDDYKNAIRCDIADISNTGSPAYLAGTITAAFFLQHFVSDIPWVHLDIAAIAFDVPDKPYFRSGATGFGVRLFTDLILNWNK